MKNIPNNLSVAFDLQPEIPRPFSAIKHLHLHDVMEIPEENPDIEQIITITVNVEIIKTNILKDAGVKSGDRESKDKDAEVFKKRKLEVEGRVHQKIEYVADLSDEHICSAVFVLPFNTSVVLGEEVEGFNEFEVKGFVRDVLLKLLDKRKIYKNVQLILVASPTLHS